MPLQLADRPVGLSLRPTGDHDAYKQVITTRTTGDHDAVEWVITMPYNG